MIRTAGSLKTIWFMGAKTRIIPNFIDGAVADVHKGGALLDLCSGTGVVARTLADRYRVFANDSLEFCSVIARAHLEADDEWVAALETLDPTEDLQREFEANLEQLLELVPDAEASERSLLAAVLSQPGANGSDAVSRYRAFLEMTPDPFAPTSNGDSVYSRYREAAEGLLAERSTHHTATPYCLTTLYYHNVYFGLRQAMVIDSLRAAIDRIPETDPLGERKRVLYLAALLYAASVSTSGTSHFAQPRSMRKDSELVAVAKRRHIDIEVEFHRALDAIRREWGEHDRRLDNRVFNLGAEELLSGDGPLTAGEVGVVYFDPPYTADNHSRFYHLLETLVSYDYPPLEQRSGSVTRGRYPVRERRFQSDFCRPQMVEAAFRTVAERCRALDASLLVSYSDTGLLLRLWQEAGEENPVARFRRLFCDTFDHVEVRDQDLMHSGQGDSNLKVRELLVLCEA